MSSLLDRIFAEKFCQAGGCETPIGLEHDYCMECRPGTHTLSFYREERGNGNRYVFVREDGTEIDLPPGATVSELQNRL